MLQLEAIELLGRLIPEAFIYALAIYVFTNTKIDKKRYVWSGFIIAAIIYLVRLLPITYGIHTIVIIIMLIIQAIAINKIEIKPAIQGTIVTMLLQFASESFNLVFIEKVLNKDMKVILQDPIEKMIYGIPSLIIMVMLILTYYLLRKKWGKHAA